VGKVSLMAKETVFVIKGINYSEADKILTVFGKHIGKFTLFARSLRKINSKNRGSMQTLSTSKIEYYEGKGMPLLTESQLLHIPDPEDLNPNIKNVEKVLILLNKVLQEDDPNSKVFDILQGVIKKNFDIDSVNRFRVLFLKEMGFLQDFSQCNVCGGKENLRYIDISNFALICKNCYSKVGKSYELGDNPYSKEFFTQALDIYVKKVIEEI
jgi:DNA repair protein RecO (recombination protein O)